jgi:hypothetical protein
MATSLHFDRNRLNLSLFPRTDSEIELETAHEAASSSTFVNNMSLPIHRWFRYSAGFSARWVETVIKNSRLSEPIKVFDPFAGSATTLVASQRCGVESWGVEAHPFVYRIAKAKLAWDTDPEKYKRKMDLIKANACQIISDLSGYPDLIGKCYEQHTLNDLDRLRRALEMQRDESPSFELAWLTLLTTLRKVSTAGTAQWQYVLPNKPKKSPMSVERAFYEAVSMIYVDMKIAQEGPSAPAHLLQSDARTCEGIASGSVNLVITSPPLPK